LNLSVFFLIIRRTFSVCTFNILSPCYKRLSSEYDRESAYESLWQARHLSIIQLLQSLNINLICLQEFWFRNPAFSHLYHSNLSSKYSFHTLRRTGSLDDGLAILVDKQNFKIINQCDFKLHDIGHRIGLLLHLEFNAKPLLLFNVHLTFPHYRFERRLRLRQMKKFLDWIDDYQTTHQLQEQCSIILCGDYNSPYANDPVYQLINRKTFQSTYRLIHGYEPFVTHLTHRKDQLGTDFIFYKSKYFRPISSELLPKDCNHLIWNNWELSDHRAIVTTFANHSDK